MQLRKIVLQLESFVGIHLFQNVARELRFGSFVHSAIIME